MASELAQAGANTAAVSVGSAAAGGGASGGVQAAVTGKDIGTGIVKGAETGALTAGLTQGAKDIYAAGQQYAASQPGYVPPVDYSVAPAPTGGGQNIKATVDTSPGYNLALTSGEPSIKSTPSTTGYDLVTPSATGGEPTLKAGPAADAFKAPSALSDTLARGVGQSLAKTLLQRGAGEIESKESGKARQNVWNEASLRLKDALGV